MHNLFTNVRIGVYYKHNSMSLNTKDYMLNHLSKGVVVVTSA